MYGNKIKVKEIWNRDYSVNSDLLKSFVMGASLTLYVLLWRFEGLFSPSLPKSYHVTKKEKAQGESREIKQQEKCCGKNREESQDCCL